MKTNRTFKTLVTIILTISALCIAISSAHAEKNSAQVDMELTARLVTLEGAPYFTADGSGTLVYESFDGGAKLKGNSIPELIYESDDPPGGLENLTVVITGIMGTNATIEWPDFPDIALKDLALKVRIFEANLEETDYERPLIEFIIRGIDLATDKITVEGVSSGGYVDVEKMEAQLVGKVVLPYDSHPEYEKYFAEKPIILEALLKLKNPFKK